MSSSPEARRRGPSWRRAVSCAAIVVLGVAISALQANVLRSREAAALEMESALAYEGIEAAIELQLHNEFRALARMAHRLEAAPPGARAAWERDAQRYVADFVHLQAIEWVDADFVVRWVVPPEGNEAAQDLDLSFEARRRAALIQAREERRVVVSRTVQLVQGQRGFLVYVPMYRNERFVGTVLAVYRTAPLFAAVVARTSPRYEISILDGETLLHGEAPAEVPALASHRGQVEIEGLVLSLEARPAPDVIAAALTPFPLLVGALGVAISVAVSLIYWFAGVARQQVRLERSTSARLRGEVARREDAERSDRASGDRLERAMESISDYLWTARVEPGQPLVFEYVSPVVERLTGMSPDAYLRDADNAVRSVVAEDRESVQATLGLLTSGEMHDVTHDYRIVKPDGSTRWMRDHARATPMESGGLRLDGVVTDVTELKRAAEERRSLDERMQQSQKLESLGLLAGGIAHDFNNLLVGVLGNAELALDSGDHDRPLRESLEGIAAAGQRAAELCRQMLAYAGRETYVAESLDLRDVVAEMEALLPAPAGVDFERVFADELPLVSVDAAQIRQVVMNLITNAVDSIGDAEGSITLRLEARECERSLFESTTYLGEPLDAGTYVVLEVSDTGSGMDEETLARMFDPFFSTKFTGRGLGLAAALGIIRAHFGAISVESRVGHGTSARVYLPAAVDAEPGWTHEGAVAGWSTGGIALLIEDEAPVRMVAKGMLERVGFKVVATASGEEGFDALRAHGSEVRFALVDLLMRGLSGSETLRLLRGVRPDLPVLVMSGCGELEAVDQLGGARGDAYLQKPFTLAEFTVAVRAALRE